jgi:hypothetical protein
VLAINAALGSAPALAAGLTVEVVNVSVSPPQVSLFTNRTQQFSALVSGTDNAAVTWSVAPADGGSITSTGIYTAPNKEGNFKVVATSVRDNRKAGASDVFVSVKPKEGKEGKDTKDTKETRFDKITVEKITKETDLVRVVNAMRGAEPSAEEPAGQGQPFIRADERPVLDGSPPRTQPAKAKRPAKARGGSRKTRGKKQK